MGEGAVDERKKELCGYKGYKNTNNIVDVKVQIGEISTAAQLFTFFPPADSIQRAKSKNMWDQKNCDGLARTAPPFNIYLLLYGCGTYESAPVKSIMLLHKETDPKDQSPFQEQMKHT